MFNKMRKVAVFVQLKAACGIFYGQKRSLAVAGSFYWQGRGVFFMP